MAIDYDKKTWGTYEWDDELTVAQNVTAARNADALIETADLQRIEDAIEELSELTIPDVSGFATTTALNTGLNGKANTTHTHAIDDVEGLESALNGKQPAGSYATTSQLADKIDVSEIIDAEDQVGLLKAVFIENGGTPPSGLDPYTLVIELEA